MGKGAYFYVESHRHPSYKSVGVPKCRMLCHIPVATQKKLRILYKGKDLTRVFHLIREKFYHHIRTIRKCDLRPTENVGKHSIEGKELFISATRVFDKIDNTESILYMSRDYRITVSNKKIANR